MDSLMSCDHIALPALLAYCGLIEQHSLKEPNLDTLPHEIYRVRRNEKAKL